MADHDLEAVSAELTRETDPHEDWLRDDLVMSQTCGLPFVRELRGKVHMLGTPCYDIECEQGSYYSVLIAGTAKAGELTTLASGRLACNDLRSQSGFAAILTHLQNAEMDLPSAVLLSGSHMRSIEMVAAGEADIAAIDAVTWALAKRHLPQAKLVRVIEHTDPLPGLPYITSLANRHFADKMRLAISDAIAGLSDADRDALLLTGFVAREDADYQPVAVAWNSLDELGVISNMTVSAK